MTDQIAPKYTEHLPTYETQDIERDLSNGYVTLRMSAGTVKVTNTNGYTKWYYKGQRITRLECGNWNVRILGQRLSTEKSSLKRCKQFVDQCLEEK